MKKSTVLSFVLLLIPIVCAVLALTGHGYGVHVAVPVVCALLIGFRSCREVSRTRWLLIAALAFSIAGDWMLKHRGGDTLLFVYGIALFFVAHVGFLVFCLKNGRIQRLVLSVLIAGYGLFFVWKLFPAIPDPVLLAAVLAYLLISCFSLAAAPGLRLSPPACRLFTAGIACIVFSDTLIACCEFLHVCGLYHTLMMPAYYAAHILIAAAVMYPPKRRRRR
ncbi:MAG: lysoplasmalogenase [Tannerella sp.]|jgi:uncharacterized membrane protein YhhN|nr:lysoplasmalogenase [Tannerella sp.]